MNRRTDRPAPSPTAPPALPAAPARRHRRAALAFIALTAVLVLAACGGGGGGGGPTAPPPPAAGLTFSPASGGGGDAVVLRRQGTGSDTLVLEVAADGVTNLYGLFFDLTYPDAVLDFEGSSEGSFMNADGEATVFELASQPGVLVVGLSRLGAVGGRTGSGVLLTLRFRATAAGSGPLAFTRNGALDGNGDPLALSWAGGTVQVTR